MSRPITSRLLWIALDAAEPRLIERWTEDGSLPHLAALRERGAYGRLASSAHWLVGSPWPTFYTSTTPGDHGFYHYLGWSPHKMAAARPTPKTFPLTPFWRGLAKRGVRTFALDIPLTYHPEPYDGVEINGWATHEVLVAPGSHPPELWKTVVDRFGSPPIEAEAYALESPKRLLTMRDNLIAATRKVGDLGTWLMERQPWDLGLIGFCATHRGGHKLWDLTNLDSEPDKQERAEIEDALRQVYIACDEAIGRLTREAGDDATVMVCSMHGMGPNTSRVELLDEMLGRVLGRRPVPEAGATSPASGGGTPGLSDRLRGLLPVAWRNAVKSRLPLSLQDRLTAFWRLKGLDYSQIEAFSLPADLQGYIRFNLKGRESKGIVEPGDAVDALRRRIEAGLRSFIDERTGESVVETVALTRELFPEGARLDALPDLLVRWSAEPVAETRRLRSPEFGVIDWPTPGRNVTGRSGNHRGAGFVIGAGPGFAPAQSLTDADILDLAPTVCALLGHAPPAEMKGRALVSPPEPNDLPTAR